MFVTLAILYSDLTLKVREPGCWIRRVEYQADNIKGFQVGCTGCTLTSVVVAEVWRNPETNQKFRRFFRLGSVLTSRLTDKLIININNISYATLPNNKMTVINFPFPPSNN